ncbi:M23 family metallopeptidase [Deinococcus sp. YIM 77859]|uniref:M23 family metallopeptidase n=1 Tax=Deinococcus sp. YIM 77859 TaxID=1540221 RepID=UPI00068BF677|nr:LysM peptidoglycan-binding domain-containing M23 family metallopeptidase [Deinococcus sp. YIM 77859]
MAPASAATTTYTTYTVQAGDTLSRIAQQHDLCLDALLAANPAVDRARALQVGQSLHLPLPARSASRSPAQVQVIRTAGFRSSAATVPLAGVITTYFRPGHPGLDIAAPVGSPIIAPATGVVVESRLDTVSGWGWTIVLAHGDGLTSRYSHNSRNLVRVGQQVTRGEVIARVGSTGHSTGPHLDYRLYRDSVPLNPAAFQLADSTRRSCPAS